MDKERFYIDNQGAVAENERSSISKAFDLAKQIDGITEVVLLIHTKSNTGYLERVFGDQKVKDLFKGTLMLFKNGPRVKIETVKTIQDHTSDKIIVAFGLESDELFVYDDYYNTHAIVGHPWVKDSVEEWAKTWGATEITTNKKAAFYPLPDTVVCRAFDDLTEDINMTTGIHHPSDEEQCKTFLRALHKYEYRLDEQEVFAYLVREKSWKTRHAKEVAELINRINTGRSFQGGRKTGLQHYIKAWKERS